MEFGGYPFPDGTASYPSGPCFYSYIKSFVKHFNLLPHIQVSSYFLRLLLTLEIKLKLTKFKLRTIISRRANYESKPVRLSICLYRQIASYT